MQETRIIKTISEIACPCCSKKIMVATRITAPIIEWALEPKVLEDAKGKLKKELEKVTFKSKQEKESVISWINDERTLFGPAEIPSLVESIKAEQEGKEVKHE